ncbi:MAG: ABC transporter ATP-binding protein [Prevotella sp.]|jgi:lipopolysaccharide transport system ATP-binding protein|nr:ABC transporter ATP-binding protein [Prevotella sp.]
MSDIAIKFENISKQYRLGLIGTGTILHDINRWWYTARGKEDPYLKIGEVNDRASKGNSKYVWALKDITFDVKQGEVVGIIGKNGAGKSTLLKILSRVTSPTTGSIKAKGRIASLLEVGTGFHPELTGRENIFMNGSIMGMNKAEIKSKMDEIVDFAGVERYIDTPVKRYSSGMTVRLGFAIAAHLEPEILVVDEVLAVGDAEFQKKAIGKMQDVSKGEGRTVLFVSHNMTAIRNLCKTGIYLENGTIKYLGEIEDCVTQYLKTNNKIDTSSYENEDSNSYIKKLDISSSKPYISTGNDFSINLLIDLKDHKMLNIDYGIYNKDEELITIISSKCSTKGVIEKNTNTCTVEKNPLIEGIYYLNVFLYDDKDTKIEFLEKCLQFEIINGDFYENNELPKVAFRSKFLMDYNWK